MNATLIQTNIIRNNDASYTNILQIQLEIYSCSSNWCRQNVLNCIFEIAFDTSTNIRLSLGSIWCYIMMLVEQLVHLMLNTFAVYRKKLTNLCRWLEWRVRHLMCVGFKLNNLSKRKLFPTDTWEKRDLGKSLRVVTYKMWTRQIVRKVLSAEGQLSNWTDPEGGWCQVNKFEQICSRHLGLTLVNRLTDRHDQKHYYH